ncbi:MAG: sulfotransferase [Polyangiaceae bacterium]|nr:sulfotransferase [Polyangiaceae bacterium]NUQ72269.1 sulfotransferase [Polyangiaceae bacterium]
MTQALLAQNPACRAPVFWEMHRPVRFPDEPDDGSRRESACRWIEDYYRRAPDEKAAHLMDVDSPDECLRLLQHNFTTLIFATRYCVKTYPKWLVNADLRPAYRYHRQLLQLQLHTRTGAPLVLKDPFHTWHLDSLFEVFPDACVVQLHRDLRQVLPSWLRLCAIAQGVSSDAVDPSRIRDQWLPLVEIGLERMAMVRKIAPSRAFLDIAYSDLVRDPAGVIRRIDEHFGFSFPEEAYSRARSWLARNPRHKHGKHRYSLEEFGLETGAIRERFAGYYDRFGPMLDEAR